MTKYNLKQKLKLLLIVGSITIFIGGALLVWAGIAATKYAREIIQNASVQQKVESSNLSALTSVQCINRIQNLSDIGAWINTTADSNIKSLILSCLWRDETSCAEKDCQKINESQTKNKDADII